MYFFKPDNNKFIDEHSQFGSQNRAIETYFLAKNNSFVFLEAGENGQYRNS